MRLGPPRTQAILRRHAKRGFSEQVLVRPCANVAHYRWLLTEYKLGEVGRDFCVFVDESARDGAVYYCFKPEHADIAFAFKMRWG